MKAAQMYELAIAVSLHGVATQVKEQDSPVHVSLEQRLPWQILLRLAWRPLMSCAEKLRVYRPEASRQPATGIRVPRHDMVIVKFKGALSCAPDYMCFERSLGTGHNNQCLHHPREHLNKQKRHHP